MEEGFVRDRSDSATGHVALWVAGPPEGSIWVGTKVRGKETHPVTTLRCVRCGYLESYALDRSE